MRLIPLIILLIGVVCFVHWVVPVMPFFQEP